MTPHAMFLELLNGGAITPELIWLVLLGRYLVLEHGRRKLRFRGWFNLPPGMSLIAAIFVYDTGVVLRSVTVWAWRRFFGAGDFNYEQTAALMIGGALIVVGSLCKIRALTYPDHGNRPWLMSAGATAAALAGLLWFR